MKLVLLEMDAKDRPVAHAEFSPALRHSVTL
jgi:hypothetical protein